MTVRLLDYIEHMQQAASDLGEAATKIMDSHPDFAEQHPTVPWRSMRGMRNRIAHGYFEINLDTVWETVHKALPLLLAQLDTLKSSLVRP